MLAWPQDILGLARLKILGDKLKKRSRKASKVYADSSNALLKALASRRHGPDALRAIDEGDDDEEDEAVTGTDMVVASSSGVSALGYRVRALAVPKSGAGGAEEVVLHFGIIDILQEWNARKVRYSSHHHASMHAAGRGGGSPAEVHSPMHSFIVCIHPCMHAKGGARGFCAAHAHASSCNCMPQRHAPHASPACMHACAPAP